MTRFKIPSGFSKAAVTVWGAGGGGASGVGASGGNGKSVSYTIGKGGSGGSHVKPGYVLKGHEVELAKSDAEYQLFLDHGHRVVDATRLDDELGVLVSTVFLPGLGEFETGVFRDSAKGTDQYFTVVERSSIWKAAEVAHARAVSDTKHQLLLEQLAGTR